MTSVSETTTLVGLLRWPGRHSLSPQMHNAAFAALGLQDEWTYEAIEASPGEFAGLVRSLSERGFVGANVTVPHKREALRVADEASAAASEIGAANTLSFARAAIRADNTDGPGFLAALPASPGDRRSLVLGAGGAARAVVWALVREGASVEIWNRTPERAGSSPRSWAPGSPRSGVWGPSTEDREPRTTT